MLERLNFLKSVILWIYTNKAPILNSKYELNKPQLVPQTMADAPSGFTPQSFALSLIIFQMISSNLHVDPYTYDVFI